MSSGMTLGAFNSKGSQHTSRTPPHSTFQTKSDVSRPSPSLQITPTLQALGISSCQCCIFFAPFGGAGALGKLAHGFAELWSPSFLLISAKQPTLGYQAMPHSYSLPPFPKSEPTILVSVSTSSQPKALSSRVQQGLTDPAGPFLPGSRELQSITRSEASCSIFNYPLSN